MKGLQQSDFTILDNDVPQTITSFEAVDGGQAGIEVTVVLGEMNIGSREAAIMFEEINKFLKSDGGRLAYPTAVAILTEKGLQSPLDFSQDGDAVSAALGNTIAAGYSAPLVFRFRFKPLRRFWPPNARNPVAKLSFGCLRVGHHWATWRTSEDAKPRQLQEEVFGNVVEVSTQLREGQITLYSLDPSALGDLDMGIYMTRRLLRARPVT